MSPDNMDIENLEHFFKNKDIVHLVDILAVRYSTTPYKIMTEMSLTEFSFNVAVLHMGLEFEFEANKPRDPKETITGGGLPSGFDVKKIKEPQIKGEDRDAIG